MEDQERYIEHKKKQAESEEKRRNKKKRLYVCLMFTHK